MASRVLGSALALLLFLTTALVASPASAAPDPGLGTDPGNGTLIESDLAVDQPSIQSKAMPALRELRAKMYDDKEVLFDGKPLYQVVQDKGMTREQYINAVVWDTNMEKSALQRAYEQNVYWGHTRPDGSSYKEADLLGRWPAEILTTQADIAVAIADIENGSWAGERDDLIRYNGKFNNDTGHLYNLINPNYRYYGFARVGGVTVGWMTGSVSGNATGTQLKGTYTFETAVNASNLSRLNGSLQIPSQLTSGATGMAAVTGSAKASTWLPAVPVRIAATYSSSNANVVTVDRNGQYRAVGGGTTTITATTSTGTTYRSTVTVSGNPVTAPAPDPEPEPTGKNYFHITNDWNSLTIAQSFVYGRAGDEVIVGDWDGNGTDTLGVRRGTTFYLNNTISGGNADYQFNYGRAGDDVIVGDWDGNGTDTLGIRRGDSFHLNNTLTGGDAEISFNYGREADEVLVGDWNGSGSDTISIRRSTTFHINNQLIGGNAERSYNYGRVGDEVLVGDFNRDGIDTVTLRRGNVIHVNNALAGGTAERSVEFGLVSDTIAVGDWNGDGIDTLAINRVE
ncbi:MAG: CAP domain-containing protein [Flaviflexus sp.]|uniref:hypothetical protein n=1 Tax=Flaviflexus sp. TaxID=1969482 RepID=UPI00352D9FC9